MNSITRYGGPFLTIAIILFALSNTQAQSGNERMDMLIRKMIEDLDMDEVTRKKFIVIYQNYGQTMKKAKASKMSRFSLYLTYKSASAKRDTEIKKIISSAQYELYKKRQRIIDNEASKMR